MAKVRHYPEKYTVKVEVDRIARDEPETDAILGVTHIEISSNGDLLLYQGLEFPSVGYTSGVWLTFDVLQKKEE